VSWTRIRGHETLVRAFQDVLRRGRLAHAYLFVGPEGIGKRLFAVELAKTLLCENPPGGEQRSACDACHACLQIQAGTHPDFQLVGVPEGKHEFPIDLMHEVIGHLALKPARGRHRVAILDDADLLSEEAANCFLKTLEEPPPASLLILIGTSPDRQMPTIQSRCQLIRFQPLPDDILAERLLAEEVVKNPDEARRLAPLCKGSFGAARLLADPAMLQFRQEFCDALTRPKIDSVALAQRLVKFVEEETKDSAVKRQRAGLVLEFVLDLLRQALWTQLGAQPASAGPAQRLAECVHEDRLVEAAQRTLEADYQVDRRLQLVLVLEAYVDALTRLVGAA
jgi:DNA polymerase-3 subunit delta'